MLVVHDGKLLMGLPGEDRSGREPYRCLPGGGLEPNESLFECGEREVREETGLSVTVTSVVFLREWVVPKSVSLDDAQEMLASFGDAPPDPCPDHAYGMEVYLWAELQSRDPSAMRPDGEAFEWLLLAQVEHEPLFPSELRAVARLLLAGRSLPGIPSFVSGLGTPRDQPDSAAFSA